MFIIFVPNYGSFRDVAKKKKNAKNDEPTGNQGVQALWPNVRAEQ